MDVPDVIVDPSGPLAEKMSLASLSSSMFSSVKSSSTLIENEGYVPRRKICLIGEEVSTTLDAAAGMFDLEVVKSLTGQEYFDDPSVVLVLDDFEYHKMDKKLANIKWRVIGAQAVITCANEEIPLPVQKRPIFNFIMKGVKTCFTGFTDVALVSHLMFLIRSMGGSVRREPDRFTTHLISMTTKGKKYEYASVFNVPVMSMDWVYECWKMRFCAADATDDYLMVHRLKPFVEVSAAFIGFPSGEFDEMVEMLESQGGQHVDPTDPSCTHIVVDDISPVTLPAGVSPAAFVVRANWFWLSIQTVVRQNEDDYTVPVERLRRPPQRCSVRRQATGPMLPRGHCGVDKENVNPSPGYRGGLRERNVRRLSLAEIPSPGNKTIILSSNSTPTTPEKTLTPTSPCTPGFCDRTLVPSAPSAELLRGTLVGGRRASSGSLPRTPVRHCGSPSRPSGTPRTPRTPGPRKHPSASPSTNACTPGSPRSTSTAALRRLSLRRKGSLDIVAAPPISQRYGAFLELMHTEENYVGILDVILQIRSDALTPSQAGGALLCQTEAKMIFGAIMPIARTHHAILKDLRSIYNNWSEAASIGAVFQKYCPDLLRDYAPFVSSFEDAKETLQQTRERNPRFNAFLRVCRGKPECGRQELKELMIRPVQRLASCVLLLREILKHTPEDCPDRRHLESAVESMSHVLSFINEDKRKMESLCKVFDVHNLIDKCPADVIASHRSLIVECEGVEMTENGFGKQGNHIAFFIFTDVILVCKKKSKVVALMKGQPGSNIPPRVLKAVDGKPYKFLQMLPLSTIRKIVDVADSEGVTNAMGVVFRGKTEVREACSYFRLPESGAPGVLPKAVLIERWSVALANHNCVADPDKFVQRETAEEAGLQSTTELLAKQINKAAHLAVQTQVIMKSAFLGRKPSAASQKSPVSSPPCVMSTFNSMSKLETMKEHLEEDCIDDAEVERPKPSSLTANIMKRM